MQNGRETSITLCSERLIICALVWRMLFLFFRLFACMPLMYDLFALIVCVLSRMWRLIGRHPYNRQVVINRARIRRKAVQGIVVVWAPKASIEAPQTPKGWVGGGLFRAGLTNVGALFRKMCGAPLPPPMPSSGDYVFNFIIKYRIDKDLDNKLDF